MKRILAPIIATFVILASVAVFLANSPIPAAQSALDRAEVVLGYQPTQPPVALGDVRFNDMAGETVTLADKRGRVVLMNFWATWCLPCVREMPSLDRLQAQFDRSVFEVVLISEDRDPAVIEPFFEKYDLRNMAAYHDPRSALSRQLAVPGLPTTLLIDHRGYELGRVVGAAEWDSPEAVALIRRYTVGAPLQAAENE